jgi:hypothetical protein
MEVSLCCQRSIPGSGESPWSTKSNLPSGLTASCEPLWGHQANLERTDQPSRRIAIGRLVVELIKELLIGFPWRVVSFLSSNMERLEFRAIK